MHIYLRRENARRDSLTAAKGLTLDSYTSDMKDAEREKGDNATVSHGPPLSYWVGSVLTAAVLPLHDLECGANRLGSTVMYVDFADFWISFGCRVIAMVRGEWDVVYSLFFFTSYFLPLFLWLRPYASMVVPFQKQKKELFSGVMASSESLRLQPTVTTAGRMRLPNCQNALGKKGSLLSSDDRYLDRYGHDRHPCHPSLSFCFHESRTLTQHSEYDWLQSRSHPSQCLRVG